jgi:hypothetical protein
MSDLAITQVENRAISADVDALTALANRLMVFPPGKALNKQEAAQLAAYSYILDADPYNDELHVTSAGVQKGIPLYRRKAKEYNMAKHGKEFGYTASYRPAKPSEADFDPSDGDIAYICTVVDEYQLERWQNRWSMFMKDAIDAGAEYKEAKQDANYICGPRPEHTGIGVVDHRESFSKGEVERWEKTPSGKSRPVLKKDADGNDIRGPEMYDRHQRAQKRALKNALKDAYPSMMAATNMVDQAEEISRIVSIVEKKVEAKQLERSTVNTKQEHNQTLIDLGLEPEYTDAEIVDVPEEKPHVDVQKTLPIIVDPPFGAGVSERVIADRVGFVDILKLNAAFERSKVLSPAMEQKWYNMWASFYAEWRKKGNDQEASADQADNHIANLLNAA